jgi:transcription initiation factor TFIIIB Brf1 subunit/transcription initiation factor TFIIB
MIQMDNELKKCNKCGINKNLSDYSKHRGVCKRCTGLLYKEYYQRTKEARKNYEKEYVKRNFKEISAKRKIFHSIHKERLNAKTRAYHIKNKHIQREKGRIYRLKNLDKIRSYKKRYVANIEDTYIKDRFLRMNAKCSDQNVIEAYRNLLKLKRLLWEIKNGKVKQYRAANG